MADATSNPGPVVLDDLDVRGGVLKGRRLTRAVLYFSDGYRVVHDHLPAAAPDEAEAGLSDMQADVSEFVEDVLKVGQTVTNDEIARRTGWKNTAKLRQFVKTFVGRGRLRRVAKGWLKTS